MHLRPGESWSGSWGVGYAPPTAGS
jgi:hypothetical protein